jgi:translation elongation factor EF-1alpha
MVLCDPEAVIPVTKKIKAQIVTFQLQKPLMKGSLIEFHFHSLNIAAFLTQLEALMEKNEVKKKKPRCLLDHQTAIVEILLDKPTCIELFSSHKQLGRFTLRENGRTVGAGIVTEILS